MKKKLEAELISIAHRILKLKNNSELVQLQKEAQLLHEKLSVLVFVEEHFSDAKPTIGKAKADKIIEEAFEAEPVVEEVIEAPTAEPVVEEVTAEPVAELQPGEEDQANEEQVEEPEQPEEEQLEAVIEAPVETPIEKELDEVLAEAESNESEQAEENDIPAEENVEVPADSNENEPAKEDDLFKPAFEWSFEKPEDSNDSEKAAQTTEEVKSETKTEAPAGQIAFEDLLGEGYVDPVFEKREDSEAPVVASYEPPVYETPKADVIPISRYDDKIPVFKMNSESTTINDRMSKGITVGLNDRIAFVKNLFNNSNEDYNRVLSQLLTFDTYSEAQDFIENMVKPDYNNWDGKDDYAQRFMEVVEKKFS